MEEYRIVRNDDIPLVFQGQEITVFNIRSSNSQGWDCRYRVAFYKTDNGKYILKSREGVACVYNSIEDTIASCQTQDLLVYLTELLFFGSQSRRLP